jgi:hypothetical protein
MASRHRKRDRAVRRTAATGLAAATVTVVMGGTALAPVANAATTTGSPGLPSMELAPGAPDPASIPDLTFGLGSQAYNGFQSAGAAFESGFLNTVNLSGLLQRLGYDPETAINAALGAALTQALTGVAIPVGGIPVLGGILTDNDITNAAALLDLLGFDLADPFDLSGAATPGLNIITAGPPFSLLKFLGVDLGWVPGYPNSVADEINGTPYLDISALGVLEALNTDKLSIANKIALSTLIATVKALPGGDLNVADVRVPVVLGFGLGAFAAGMAYPQVVADLPNQPGGADYTGDSPLAGSVTILPMILLRNPGRANGGLFARFYPVAGLFGIDTVTPDTEVTNSVDPDNPINIPVGNTGIVLGGANLIPIKIDGTVEYDPLSDVPAWPNPFALANSAAALAFPTYIVRGVTAASLTELVNDQLTPQLAEALGNTDGPLALNLYLTVPVNNALPLLEPVRLPVDAINLLTGANLNNPLATALEPALTTLVNLGYTDVERTVVDGVPVYDRTLDQADVITPFGTLPSGIDWAQVPADLVLQLQAGIEQAIADGLINDSPVVNPLATLANLLGLSGLPGAASAPSPLTGTTDLSGLTDNAVTTTAGAVTPAIEQSPSTVAHSDDKQADVTPAADPDPEPVIDADEDATPPRNTSTPSTRRPARVDVSVKKAADGFGKIAKDVRTHVRDTVKAVSGAGKPNGTSTDQSTDKDGDDAS